MRALERAKSRRGPHSLRDLDVLGRKLQGVSFSSVRPFARERPYGSRPARGGLPDHDRDLLPVLALGWLASVMRVAGAFYTGQAFGVEATLALSAALLIPLGVWRYRSR